MRVHTVVLPAAADLPERGDDLPAELPDVVRASGSDGSAPLLEVRSPTSGERLLDVEDTTPEAVEDVVAAVAAVSRADWAWLSGEDRARHLFAVADVLAAHVRPLAVTAALGTGRPVAAGLSVDGPAAHAAAFSAAGWADKLAEAGARPRPGGGVVVVPTTWRTAAADALGAVVAGLATGCGVLLRPRPAAAAGAARLAALLQEAGLPPGLVATAPGADAATDARLWAHRELVAVRADGCAEDLRALALALAPAGVPLVGRTDGPAVHVVLAGADLAAVLPVLLAAVAGGAHEHPGGTRVLVARGLADALVRRLTPAVRRLRVGDPLERATAVGPLPSPHLALAAREAAGAPVPDGLPEQGWWSPPALVRVGRHSPWPPPGPVLGVRGVRSAADVPAHLAGAGSVRVWGGELGAEAPAPPEHRREALELLRACRG